MRIWSSRLIIKVLLGFFVRPFWRFMFHFSTRSAAFSRIISTAGPNTQRIIFWSFDVTWVSITFWHFWILRFSFPVWYRRICYIVLTTKPIWVRRDPIICCRFWIDFSMINTELRRSIFWSSFVFAFSASRSIPRRSTASPAFWPKSHPRTKLIHTWMMNTWAFFIFIFSIFASTSMSHAYHYSISNIVSFFSWWLFLVSFWDSCRMFMHSFVGLYFWLIWKLFLLSNTNFMRIAILESKNNQFVKNLLVSWHFSSLSNFSIKPKSILFVSLFNLAQSAEINIKATIVSRFILISNNFSIWENWKNAISHIIKRKHIFIFRMSRVIIVKMTLIASSDVNLKFSRIPLRI